MSNIGEKIKALRAESGITQLQLGKYVGCSAQVISNIERGYSRPAADTLNKVAEFFHVPSDYLLGNTAARWEAANPDACCSRLGDRISTLLKKRDISAESFASAAGISFIETEGILAGTVMPNTDTLSQIALVLNTSMDFLIGTSLYSTIIQSEDEEDIILYYRNMSKHGKRLFMGALEDCKDK